MELKDVKDDLNRIPDYLTKRNKSFKEMLDQALSTNKIAVAKLDHTHQIDELRRMAIVIYKIRIIQMNHDLWTVYYQSGMGELLSPSQAKLSYSTTVSIWPKQIKMLIQQLNNVNKTVNQHQLYVKFVQDHLHEMDQQLNQLQIELNLKVKTFEDYISTTIQKRIETYVEENLQSYRRKIEHQIQLVHYDYHIRALKLEYLRYQRNAYQVCLFNTLSFIDLAHQSYFRNK